MTKKKVTEEARKSSDNLNDTKAGFVAKLQKNKKLLSIIGVAVAVVVVGILAYTFLIKKPAVNKQNEAIAKVDKVAFDQVSVGGFESLGDSAIVAYYKKVAEGGYDAGNRAKLMSAIGLYKQGNYDEAIKYLQDYDVQDKIIGPVALSLLGDCYVNTDKLNDAIEAYNKAVDKSDKNPYLTPVFMVKLAHIYHYQKKYGDEAAQYEEIVAKYPQYLNATYFNIEKDLERAKMLSGK